MHAWNSHQGQACSFGKNQLEGKNASKHKGKCWVLESHGYCEKGQAQKTNLRWYWERENALGRHPQVIPWQKPRSQNKPSKVKSNGHSSIP